MSLDRRFLDVSLNVKGVANEPALSPTPINGTQYIVGATPSGAFASANTNDIARYDGNKWKFAKPDTSQLEVMNIDTLEILGWNGAEWTVLAQLRGEKPVLDVLPTGSSLPPTTGIGDKFLNTIDGKVYIATADNTWDTGTATNNGDRYASTTNARIYEKMNGALKSSLLPDGAMFISKGDGKPYGYDAGEDTLIRLGGGGSWIAESHVLTAAEATAKGFSLAKSVASGSETNVLLAVCGVVQTMGTDFTVNGNAVNWTNKGLDTIGLTAGDVFVIHYEQA